MRKLELAFYDPGKELILISSGNDSKLMDTNDAFTSLSNHPQLHFSCENRIIIAPFTSLKWH